MLSFANIANAVPNVWKWNLYNGFYYHTISTEDNSQLYIGCGHITESPSGRTLKVTYKGKTIENSEKLQPLSLYLDDQYSFTPMIESDGLYGNTIEWNETVEKLPYAKKIEVYSNNKFLFILKPRNSGSEEITDLVDCKF